MLVIGRTTIFLPNIIISFFVFLDTYSVISSVSIEDNGIGFNNEQAERIFGMFQRLHGRGEYEGTGIGLAICRKIVQRHGGSITASGRPGEGATFTVRLPRHHAQSSEEGGSRG